ncbi:MAG: NAD(P)H-hydrate dehydratase [Candidatus Margulisiibacteriota bacterium]|jgi:NAD(P)H-hydrate epimerase
MINYRKCLPKRRKDFHKGDCGRVGIIAGSSAMLGSAILASKAALRSGAGLVYLMTIEEALPYINIVHPELIILPLMSRDGVITFDNIQLIKKYHEEKKFHSLAIGPGLTTSYHTQRLIPQIMRFASSNEIKLVLDADALNVINLDDFKHCSHHSIVLTPHAKEFERIYGKKPVEKDQRIYYAEDLAKKIKQIVVLKGYETVIADEKDMVINKTGNNALATAGTGDVLTGIIASFLAQGVPAFQAAALGVYLHGLAGDLAQKEKTNFGVISSDLLTYLPKAFKKIC